MTITLRLSLRDLCPDVEMVDAGIANLSLRDLCQQDDRDEMGAALAKVAAISILGSCESIQWLKFVVGYHFRLLRKRGSQ